MVVIAIDMLRINIEGRQRPIPGQRGLDLSGLGVGIAIGIGIETE